MANPAVIKDLQGIVAVLAAAGSIGTSVLNEVHQFLPAGAAAAITSALTVVAAVAGFLRTAEEL